LVRPAGAWPQRSGFNGVNAILSIHTGRERQLLGRYLLQRLGMPAVFLIMYLDVCAPKIMNETVAGKNRNHWMNTDSVGGMLKTEVTTQL